MTDKRKDCQMRHENGNCTVSGGFCTAVNDPICEALHNAFDCGYRSALRQQEPNDWICTLKCTALMDEGMCSHGGLCCLYESQRTIKENQPLTLDELREMDGEPVWVRSLDGNGKDIWAFIDTDCKIARIFVTRFSVKCMVTLRYFKAYGKTWLAYRQKPEEDNNA